MVACSSSPQPDNVSDSESEDTANVEPEATNEPNSPSVQPSPDAPGQVLPSIPPQSSASSVCGDGRVSLTEECDDQNTLSDDGCSAQCHIECGDGVISGLEVCDDGNRADNDGCPEDCGPHCGDGRVEGSEQCDTGEVPGSYACVQCNVLPGWACSGAPSACEPNGCLPPLGEYTVNSTVHGSSGTCQLSIVFSPTWMAPPAEKVGLPPGCTGSVGVSADGCIVTFTDVSCPLMGGGGGRSVESTTLTIQPDGSILMAHALAHHLNDATDCWNSADAIFTPIKVEAGDACWVGTQCTSGTCCLSASGADHPGVCGEAWECPDHCDGLRCDEPTPPPASLEPGALCLYDESCRFGLCASGVCNAPADLGCAESCDDDTWCASGACNNGACVRCIADEEVCETALQCVSGLCNGTCTPLLAVGSECESAEQCDSKVCCFVDDPDVKMCASSAPECSTKVGVGSPCGANIECLSNICFESAFCTKACMTHADCGISEFGEQNWCVLNDASELWCSPGCTTQDVCANYGPGYTCGPTASAIQLDCQ